MLDPGGITISTRPNAAVGADARIRRDELPRCLDHAARPPTRRLRRARVSVRDRARPRGDRDRRETRDSQYSPSVAFDGTNYLVVWEDDPCHRILGRRVSQGGVPDGDGSFLISYCSVPRGKEPRGKVWIQKMDPAVAFDGVNYLVTWVYLYGNLSGYYTDIQGARVTPARTVLDPRGSTSAGRRETSTSPSVVFGGSTYLVVWECPGSVGPASRARAPSSILTGSWCPRLLVRVPWTPSTARTTWPSGTTRSMSSGRA